MTRLCGLARKGERFLAPVPHGHWKTTTFVAALHHDRITAPLVIDCPVNSHIFETYVKNAWPRPSAQATSLSWILGGAQRSRGSAKPSRTKGPTSSTCRLILPTKIRSRCSFQNVRRCSKRRRNDLSMTFGTGSAKSSTQRQSWNARISSVMPDMIGFDRKMA